MLINNKAIKLISILSISLGLFACSESEQQMWQPRVAKGSDALVASAINGFGLMPAKGGQTQLTDEEIELAVNYFLSQIK